MLPPRPTQGEPVKCIKLLSGNNYVIPQNSMPDILGAEGLNLRLYLGRLENDSLGLRLFLFHRGEEILLHSSKFSVAEKEGEAGQGEDRHKRPRTPEGAAGTATPPHKTHSILKQLLTSPYLSHATFRRQNRHNRYPLRPESRGPPPPLSDQSLGRGQGTGDRGEWHSQPTHHSPPHTQSRGQYEGPPISLPKGGREPTGGGRGLPQPLPLQQGWGQNEGHSTPLPYWGQDLPQPQDSGDREHNLHTPYSTPCQQGWGHMEGPLPPPQGGFTEEYRDGWAPPSHRGQAMGELYNPNGGVEWYDPHPQLPPPHYKSRAQWEGHMEPHSPPSQSYWGPYDTGEEEGHNSLLHSEVLQEIHKEHTASYTWSGNMARGRQALLHTPAYAS